MTKRFALAALVLSTVLVALAYAAAFLPGGAPPWAPWLLALGTAAMMVSVMALGAARTGRGVGRRLGWAFALTFLMVAGGFALALSLPGGDGPATALWLGLPPRAAVVVYGVGLLPMLVLPIAYARTFDEVTLGEDDLERVREARRAQQEREARAAGGAAPATAGAAGGAAAGATVTTFGGPPPERQDTPGNAAERHPAVAARSNLSPTAAAATPAEEPA